MKKRYIILGCIGISAVIYKGALFSMQQSQRPKSLLDARVSASEVFQTIDNAKVATFSSDNLIRSGIEGKEVNSWRFLVQDIRGLVEQGVTNKEVPAEFDTYAKKLNSFSDQLIGMVTGLHDAYASLYVKTLEGKVSLKKITTIEQRQINGPALNKGVQQLNTMYREMQEIAGIAEDYLLSTTPFEDVYNANNTLKDAEQVFKGYKKFLADYEKSGRGNISSFLMRYVSSLQNYTEVRDLIEKLEKIEFIMREKLKIQAVQERRQNLATVSEILVLMGQMFPKEVDFLGFKKIMRSTNKPAIAVFAFVNALMPPTNQVRKEMNVLLDADAALQMLKGSETH